MGEDGSADLQYVLAVAKGIGENMTHHMYIIDKSTVPVGTAEKVKAMVQETLDKRGSDLTFDVISNPEFLKEGAAVADFMKPDRVVIGADNENAFDMMRELYAPFTHSHERFVGMDIKSAEMTKYAANAMLATKISFMNEIANICERVGADVNQVRHGIGSDSRIGYSFIYPGCGYGGSCFPKDVQALAKTSKDFGYEPKILDAVEAVNYAQKLVISDKVIKRFGEDLSGKTFAVWGLAFKPETDDMREASSITIINELTKRGAR
jgi:UDPglucose 6-dehydrogenase